VVRYLRFQAKSLVAWSTAGVAPTASRRLSSRVEEGTIFDVVSLIDLGQDTLIRPEIDEYIRSRAHRLQIGALRALPLYGWKTCFGMIRPALLVHGDQSSVASLKFTRTV
jgi:hypothetical protein